MPLRGLSVANDGAYGVGVDVDIMAYEVNNEPLRVSSELDAPVLASAVASGSTLPLPPTTLQTPTITNPVILQPATADSSTHQQLGKRKTPEPQPGNSSGWSHIPLSSRRGFKTPRTHSSNDPWV
jgi:hypothetical protein